MKKGREQSPGSLFAFSMSLCCIYSSTCSLEEEEEEEEYEVNGFDGFDFTRQTDTPQRLQGFVFGTCSQKCLAESVCSYDSLDREQNKATLNHTVQ